MSAAVNRDLLLVNAAHPLGDTTPPPLAPATPETPGILLERRAAALLNALIDSVGGRGRIAAVSGYRSRSEQQAIWDETWAAEGPDFTNSYVARPGCSEHQTGLAIDLGLLGDGELDFIRPNFPEDGVAGDFRRAAADFGFILRYPAGKEAVTGIAHEPWHFRFVGVPHSRRMAQLGLTLEEYLEELQNYSETKPLHITQGRYDFTVYTAPRRPRRLPSGYVQLCPTGGGCVVTAWR